MKHGTILIFKHTFGQLVEDNVESDESGFEYSIGCHAGVRREFYGEKKPPVIDPAVAQWRLNSLKGTTGAPCPTRKIVPGSVSDEELAREAHYREMAARVRFATPEEMRCPAPPLITSEFQEAIRAQMEARNEYRRAMFRFFERQYAMPYRPEELERGHDRADALAMARFVPLLFRRPDNSLVPVIHPNGTTSHVWTASQSFAMLGGYRPDRHEPEPDI